MPLEKTANNNTPKSVFSAYKIRVIIILLIAISILWYRYPRTDWHLGENAEELKISVDSNKIKHVVLISIDTLRADHLGCYGYSRNTSPNIDSVAKDGILFNHAVSPVPITLPSHSSMMTGKTPLQHKVRDNNSYRLSDVNVTLAETLKANGFATGAAIGAFVLDSQFGIDQGFDEYDDTIESRNNLSTNYSERDAKEVTHWGLDWLDKNRNRKSFLFLHYFDAHALYKLRPGYAFQSFPFLTLSKDKYDSEIGYVDNEIGRIVKKLKELGIYDSTLLIITSDHGESLGDHDETTHSFFTYHSTLHVPLVMRLPGGTKRTIVHNSVGLIDIFPTVCGYLGLQAPEEVEGIDLSSILSGKNSFATDRYLYFESLYPTKFDCGPLIGTLNENMKYIHSGVPELYDLKKDRHELKNLFDIDKDNAEELRAKLKSVLEDKKMNKVLDYKTATNERTRKKLESLGYVSSGDVDETIEFDSADFDPHKYIEMYNFYYDNTSCIAYGQLEKAKKICNEMEKKRPDLPQTAYYRGVIATLENNHEEMERYFTRYLKQVDLKANNKKMQASSNYQLTLAHKNLAVVNASRKEYRKATEHYKHAKYYSPFSVKQAFDLGNIYLLQGMYKNAIVNYKDVIEFDANHANAQFLLAEALFATGDFKEAIEHYRKAASLDPTRTEAAQKYHAAIKKLSEMNQKDEP